MKLYRSFIFIIPLTLLLLDCSGETSKMKVLRSFPLNSRESILTSSNVELDKEITADGDGSIKIQVENSNRIYLFELDDIDVENARLTYQAKLKSRDLEGKAYLEMWCHFKEKGEFFSRSLQSTISGSVDWMTVKTPFFLKKGENPELVKLNLVIEGTGTVWIDDIKLIKNSLK